MKLDVTEYIDTLEHYRSNFEQVRDQFEQVLNDLGNYESEMGEAFVGETGDALREKVRQSITDFRDNYFLLEESMQYAMNQIVAGAVEEFGEEGAVDTIEVLFERERLRKVVDYAIELFEETNRIMRNEDLIALEPLNTDRIEDCFSFFRSACNQVIGDVETFDKYVKQQMISVNDDIAILCEKLNIEPYYIVGINESGESKIILNQKYHFTTALQELYGFDSEEVAIMYKLWQEIVIKYPNESDQYHAWLFTRIIAYLGSYNDWKWDMTAGQLPPEFKRYVGVDVSDTVGVSGIVKEEYNIETVLEGLMGFNLTEDEARLLYIAIDRQHTLCNNISDSSKLFNKDGTVKKEVAATRTYEKYKVLHNDPNMSEEEFRGLFTNDVDRFYGTGDFSHMTATLSTGFNPSEPNLLVHMKTKGKVFISSGYYGDVTDVAGNPALGNDDYIADLDSDNIFNRYNNNKDSFMDVFMEYNIGVYNGETSRSQEFLSNHGGIEGITKKLYGADLMPGTGVKDYGDLDILHTGATPTYEDVVNGDSVRSTVAMEEAKKFLEALAGGYDTLSDYEASLIENKE